MLRGMESGRERRTGGNGHPDRPAARRVWKAAWAAACCLAAGAPVAVGQADPAPTVVVISPHNSSIRYEFGRAFARWHQETYGRPAQVEWRNVGGTSDAVKFVLSEFESKPEGIGIDVFFGGGPEPYLRLAEMDLAEPCPLPAEVLAGIPQRAAGIELYDPQFRWYGAALSSFGILQNLRVLERLGLDPVERWADLARPELCDWVAGGDPRRSGTMNNMYEAYLQACGWERGWQLLTQLAGNISQFDRLSSSTAKQVTLGEAACGLAIDFYAFTQIAYAGRTNLTFVLPRDFTAISIDGIAVLKGAPHRELARRFVRFVMDEPGQKLWHLPKGHPEGPQRFSIERMAVRPDLYRRYRDVSNVAFSPFELQQTFRYDPRLAQARRDVMSAMFGSLLVDTHTELRAAWKAVIRRGLRPDEVAELGRVPLGEQEALGLAHREWKDPAFRTRQRIQWQNWAQAKYRRLVRGGAD
ncbi:MAG: ABC transporter substrate-binding protein [Verrucomicrobia bacterium]|nr:MAG: ABC transporter substrate-binding protein [Verrucomicrobiota bacterium]